MMSYSRPMAFSVPMVGIGVAVSTWPLTSALAALRAVVRQDLTTFEVVVGWTTAVAGSLLGYAAVHRQGRPLLARCAVGGALVGTLVGAALLTA